MIVKNLIILLLLILSVNCFSYVYYFQLSDDLEFRATHGQDESIWLNEKVAYKTKSYDYMIKHLEYYSAGNEVFEELGNILESKRNILTNPLIILGDDMEAVILDQSLNYVITSKGNKISFLDIESEKAGEYISKAMIDNLNFMFSTDISEKVENKCTDFLFQREVESNSQGQKILEFLEATKGMKCSDQFPNGDVLDDYIYNNMQEDLFSGCITCFQDVIPGDYIVDYIKEVSKDESNYGCFESIIIRIAERLSKEQSNHLVSYFVDGLDPLIKRDAKYIHEDQRYEFATEDINLNMEFILKHISLFGTSGLEEEQVDLLLKQTNTVDDASRMEPSDIISWHFGALHLDEIGENQLVRNHLARNIIKSTLRPDPNKIKKPIVVSLSEFGEGQVGEKGIFLGCPGNNARVYKKIGKEQNEVEFYNEGPEYGVNLSSGVKIPISQILLANKEDQKLYIECDNEEFEISFDDIQGNNMDLSHLEEFRFKFGDDNIIDATSTLGLVNEMDYKLGMGMKFAFGLKGYKLVSEREVSDVKVGLLEELESTDVYMPINHSMSLDGFSIGTKEGIEFIFIKELDNGKKIRLKVYTPPYDVDEDEIDNRDDYDAHSDEIVKSLARRKEADNNLMVMNLSCEAERTIPQWMNAYSGAIELNVEKEILAPVVIASKRSFSTSSFDKIKEHMEYPFGILELAGKEASIDDVMSFLSASEGAKFKANRSFAPISNVGKDYALDSETRISGTVKSPDGTEEKF